MTSKTILNKNFGLTEHEFDQLKQQLCQGDEALFERVFLSHFEVCLTYLRRKYKLPYEKAYDVSMDALLAFRRRMVEGKVRYGNLRFLFTQLASHLYLKEIGRAPSRDQQKAVQVYLMEPSYQLDEEDRLRVKKAWNKLGDRCRQLLHQVYYNNVQIKDIAETLQMPAATLRKQKQRCVEKLRQFFND